MPIRRLKIRGVIPELDYVAPGIQRRAMPRLVKAVTQSAIDQAPQRRGFGSRKSIVSRIKGRVEREGERGVVASKAPHSHLIEFGVKAHPLQKKRKRKTAKAAMTIMGPGSGILRKTAQHPGHAANPYMARAIPAAGAEIKVILASESAQALGEAVKGGVKVSGDLAKVVRNLT